MKKFCLILISVIILLCICGCDNKKNEIEENEKPENNLIKELNCSALSNKKYNIGNYFITNDNDLYVLNTHLLYSNDENCKKINDDNVKILKLMLGDDYYYVMDSNNNIFQFESGSDKMMPYVEHTNHTNMVRHELKTLKDDEVVIQISQYIIKKDGNLYQYRYRYENGEIEDFILYQSFDHEKILEFGYYGNVRVQYETYSKDITSNYIKTDKAYYTSTISNKECLKYADVECEFEFIKNEELTNIYDDINIYTGNLTYIAKDKNQYKLPNN